MKESHRPFLDLVLSSTDKFSERQVKAFLEGDNKNDLLAKAYELWSYGNNGGAEDLLVGALTLKSLEGKPKKALQGMRGNREEAPKAEPKEEEISATV